MIQPHHARQMVLAAQRRHNAIWPKRTIDADGVYGPDTMEALNLSVYTFATADPDPDSPLKCAVHYAAAHWGKGGNPGSNNESEYLRELRRTCDFDKGSTGSWCAIFCSALFKLNFCDVPFEISPGAKAIVRNVGDYLGRSHSIAVRYAQEGDVGIASWDRGTGWQGHVRFWVFHGGRFYCLGGNEDPGDRVRCSSWGPNEFSKRLHQMVRF